jgi:ADP-ribosyl-[dinitrogen reductase] hydrolase
MRTAIVGLSAPGERQRTADSALAVARLTHADPLAGDSCILWSEAVRIAVTEHRLDLAAGLDLVPPGRRDQWANWIALAERHPPHFFHPTGLTARRTVRNDIPAASWTTGRSTPPIEACPPRCAVTNANTSAGCTSRGSLPTTVKNTFRS